MAIEAIDWGAPPTLTNASDATTYVMGVEFTVSEAVPCPGVRWRVPDSITPAPTGGTYYVSLYQDGTGRIRHEAITPTPGGDQDFAWPQITLEPGNTYTAQVYTQRYSFAGSSSYPYATPSGVVSATRGKLSTAASADVEATGNSATSRFYLSPLVGEEDPAEGIDATLAATLPALTAALTGTVDIQATLGATLPALTAELFGDASIAATLAATLPALTAALTGDSGGEPVPAAMGLSAVMHEIASVLSERPEFLKVVPYPAASVARTPAAVVTYPETIRYDGTYGPRSVTIYERIAVVLLAGQVAGNEKTAAKQVSAWTSGPTSIKIDLETHEWVSCDTAEISEADVSAVAVGGVAYLAVTFYVTTAGYGA